MTRDTNEMTIEDLRKEVAFWRQNSAATLFGLTCSAKVRLARNDPSAVDLIVNSLRPQMVALSEALAGDLDSLHCEACSLAIEDGQRVFSDAEGGYLHADCLGEPTTTEGFVDAEGEPLAADAPIPQSTVYAEFYTPAKIVEQLAQTKAFLESCGQEEAA